ncbi:hypothetical protein EV361DRAFT_30337 [Lentinula raphanica]|nr:hypothetical protein EV361DRAFT_30337 [Lentinula raphanica]
MPGSHQRELSFGSVHYGRCSSPGSPQADHIGSTRMYIVSMSPNQHVPFISDIAADVLKPLFITCCSITTASFVLRLIQYFRHSHHHRRRRPHFTIDIQFAVSVICTVIEYRSGRLINFHRVSHLKQSFWMKTIVAGILITFAIVFAATESKILNVGCVFEWAVSLRFTFHLLKFYHDLRPENSLNSRDVEGVHKGEFSMMDHLDHLDHLDRTVDNETLTLGNVTMSRVVSRGDRGFYQLAVVVCFRNPDEAGSLKGFFKLGSTKMYVILTVIESHRAGIRASKGVSERN